MNAPAATSPPGDGSDGRHRHWDPWFGAMAVKVLPGDHYVTADPSEMLVTVLGSCVAACIRDRGRRIGGMNHFMLPMSRDGCWGKAAAAMRYGNFAMERLINDVLKRGGTRERLEIKAFGGAVVSAARGIGDANATFLETYLREEGLPLNAHCLRPSHPLRVHFFPSTGRVFVLPLDGEDGVLRREEADYRRAITQHPPVGDVELFDGASNDPARPRPRGG